MADGAHGYMHSKDAYLTRPRRIDGRARGLQRIVEEDQYCIDILTQTSAVTKALQSVALGLLDEHLGHCVVRAVQHGGPEADAKVRQTRPFLSRVPEHGGSPAASRAEFDRLTSQRSA